MRSSRSCSACERARRGLRPHRAILDVLALLLLAAGSASAFDGLLEEPAFAHLIERVQAGSADERQAFASVALDALIRANRHELGSVAGGGAADGRAARGWRAATAGYVAHLERVAAVLLAAEDVQVLREAGGAARLIAAGEQVMISAPRLDRQAALEADITAAFCAARGCATMAAAAQGPGQPPAGARIARPPDVRAEWQFSDRAPPVYANSDGLNCIFADPRHLRLKAAACEAVMQELRRLAAALRATVEHGAAVDWSRLAIESRAGGGLQRVVYDGQGGFFDLELPYLAGQEATWRGAIPWLQARLRGHVSTYMIDAPEELAYRVGAATGGNR